MLKNMNIVLDERELRVNKYKCHSVTIIQQLDGTYKATLFDILGRTKKTIYRDRFGYEKTKTLRLKLNLRSRGLSITAQTHTPLHFVSTTTFGLLKGLDYYFAQNKKGNYINCYRKK